MKRSGRQQAKGRAKLKIRVRKGGFVVKTLIRAGGFSAQHNRALTTPTLAA